MDDRSAKEKTDKEKSKQHITAPPSYKESLSINTPSGGACAGNVSSTSDFESIELELLKARSSDRAGPTITATLSTAEDFSDYSDEEDVRGKKAEDSDAEDEGLGTHLPLLSRTDSTQHTRADNEEFDAIPEIETNVDLLESRPVASSPGEAEEGAGKLSRRSSLRSRRRLARSRRNRFVCIVVASCALLLIVAVVIIIPVSIDVVEYHQLALAKSRTTGAVDSSRTYLSGCYVMAPDNSFVYLQRHAYSISSRVSIFSRDKLSLHLTISMQYFLRPMELGQLWDKLEDKFQPVIRTIVQSEVKNLAATMSLEDLRLRRKDVWKRLHVGLQRRLGGTCCPSCCYSDCSNSVICGGCQLENNCTQGYHIDVHFFQLKDVDIPRAISNILLQRSLQTIKQETALIQQEKAVVLKKTQREVQAIKNTKDETLANGTATSAMIVREAEARALTQRLRSDTNGWNSVCQKLGLVGEEQKASFYWIRALNWLSRTDRLMVRNDTQIKLVYGVD